MEDAERKPNVRLLTYILAFTVSVTCNSVTCNSAKMKCDINPVPNGIVESDAIDTDRPDKGVFVLTKSTVCAHCILLTDKSAWMHGCVYHS